MANAVIYAVRTGNLNAVKRAVGTVADINATDSLGRNALHHAGILGNIDITTYLLANDADSKQTDVNDKVPFQLAIEYKMNIERAKVASVLLHAAVGVTGRDKKGWNALHWAILAKDIPLIDRWLDDGATLLRYGQMIERQHPIEIAFLTKDAQLIDYLVDRYVEWKGNVALWSAVNSGIYALVETMINKGYSPANTEGHISNQSLTRAAVHKNDAKILALLLTNGAPVDDQQPLLEAARNNKYALVKLLVDYGTDINVNLAYDWNALLRTSLLSRDKDLFTKIIAAAASNDSSFNFPNFGGFYTGKNIADFIEIVDALLEHGVDINTRNEKGNTILHLGIESRDRSKIEALVSRGANIEIRNADGYTPLMLAADIGESDIVKELIKNGADVYATNNEGTHDALSLAWQALKKEHEKTFKSPQIGHYKRIIELLKRHRQ